MCVRWSGARHVAILVHQLNLRSAKSLATPGVKSTSSDIGPALPLEKHTPFRSMCMRASCLAEDRPDVRFACKGRIVSRWFGEAQDGSVPGRSTSTGAANGETKSTTLRSDAE